jgi:glycosyltransferase involved in cell wall biosynthesis
MDERSLNAAYRSAAFTVYPSLMEGFGLPVIESLARGKACVCSGLGALGESARGGGCFLLDGLDSKSLASAIGQLLGDPQLLLRLEGEARARTFKTWAQYAAEISDWMATLPRHRDH